MRFLWRLFQTFVLSLSGIVLFATAAHAASLQLGKPAPALSATTLNGQSFDLSREKNKVVIINFWASWCSPCRQEMPTLENYFQQHRAQGLRVIAINMDDAKNAAAVRDIMRAFTFPAALADAAHFDGYGRIWRLPMTFVVDREGTLRKDGSVGAPKIDAALLDTLVTPLLQIPAASGAATSASE